MEDRSEATLLENAKPVILSAEDDPDDRLLIEEAVETICPSLHLEFVQNGKELLDRLSDRRTEIGSRGLPSLILLDLNMPLMDGREALKRIKKEGPFKELPVVVFTTSSETKDQAMCREFGAADFVSKPSSFEELVKALKAVLLKWLPQGLMRF